MKIIECPRDAMQGVVKFIPTSKKIDYINKLLKIGFDTIDFGSFVSPKAIPQLKDTDLVLKGLDLTQSSSKLLSIVANKRGATQACSYDQIDYLGFPLSVSEEFQKRNTNKTISQAINVIEEIQNLSLKFNKELVVYLSMAFGNPYNEIYHPEIVAKLTEKLNNLGVKIIALSDTIGVSEPNNIAPLFSLLINEYSNIEFGAHFHTNPNNWKEKIDAALDNGCSRFDSALKGYGGCPMANDKLVGNVATENLVKYFNTQLNINTDSLSRSMDFLNKIF